MDEALPKHLQVSLMNLLKEHGLSGWSIHGSKISTTVILRFKMEDTIELNPNQNVKFKRVSPSQQARDTLRAQQRITTTKPMDVKDQHPPDNVAELIEIDNDKSKQDSTMVNTDTIVEPRKVCSPRRTRSKAAKVTTKPSPVPQVDGNVDYDVLHA